MGLTKSIRSQSPLLSPMPHRQIRQAEHLFQSVLRWAFRGEV